MPMNFGDILTSAWGGVKSRKFRFVLNLIGILIGCAAVTGLISLTQGLSNSITGQLQLFGPQNVMVIPGGMSTGQLSLGTLTYKDLGTIQKVPGVAVAAPIIANKVASYNVKGTTYRTQVFGINEDFVTINKNAKIADGRALTRNDRGVVIIGANIAWPQSKDAPVLGVGDRITLTTKVGDQINTLTIRVIGVLEKTGASFGADLDNSMAMPLRDAQQFFGTGNEYSYILVGADSLDHVNTVAQAIKAKLGKGYNTITYESAMNLMNQVMGSIQAVLGGIAAISLIVAGIGIINTMTISVMERTKEIGVMKAIGAKSMNVLLIFLSEAILTGICGGVFGAAFGFVVSGVVGSIISMAIEVSLQLGFLVVGFAVLTCVVSGIYPAWHAAKLNPVEALRSE